MTEPIIKAEGLVKRSPAIRRKVRRAIGLAGQYAAVEPTMTGRENPRMVAPLAVALHRREA